MAVENDIPTIIHEMTLDRGHIVNSFAQVEYLLGRLIFEALRHDAYRHIKEQMPFGIGGRVNMAHRLIDEGPLRAAADDMRIVLDRVLDFEPVRHTLVHGFCSFHYTPDGDAAMRFDRFVPPVKKGRATHVQNWYRPSTMREQRDSAVGFVEGAIAAFEEAFKALGAPNAHEDLDWSIDPPPLA